MEKIMENYKIRGFQLTPELQKAMKTYREKHGDSLRSVVNGKNLSHMAWNRAEKTGSASWESWSEIYKLLLSAGLIDGNDVDIMPIEKLRDLLKKYMAGEKQPALVGNNNNINQSAVGDHAVNNVAADDVIDRVMGSDMCDKCKIIAYNLIKGKWN